MRELNILVVDDDRDLAESMADYLALDGHRVDIATTGQAGIKAASEKNYDLVLMDVVLPDINGVDSLRAIKKARPSTRVLLISGYSADFLDSTEIDAEILEVLTKPVDLNALNQRLAAIGDNGTTDPPG